jgi:GH18 family chitinase
MHPIMVNPSLRSKFVETAVKMLEDYGLDGLDIDYEYPSNDEQARGYVELLKELRHALDTHARNKGADYRFLLTVKSVACHAVILLTGLKDRGSLWPRQLQEASCQGNGQAPVSVRLVSSYDLIN